MAGSPRFKVYSASGEYVASCKYPDIAAAVVSLLGAGSYSAGEFVEMCGFAIDALHESAILDQRDLLMVERNALLVTLRDLHAALNPTLGGQAVSLDERGLRRLLDASNKAADVLALFRETLDRLSPRSGPESAVEAQEGR